MLIFPAIDLFGGRAVRLAQGNFQRVTDFGPDPLRIALGYLEAGASWLHVVDLDGAQAGGWRNLEVIARIAAATPIPVQAGGGARDRGQIEAALNQGIARVIVGTAAVESIDRVADWVAAFGDRLAVSLDARDGSVMAWGWTAASPLNVFALAETLKTKGVARFIYTEIQRDGMLGGVDLAGLRKLLPLGLPVIVAGGVHSYADIEQLRDAGAEGAIIGRAFLEGRLDVREAVRIAGARPGSVSAHVI